MTCLTAPIAANGASSEKAKTELMSDDSLTRHDKLDMWRCPLLGGPVDFKYCRGMNEGRPCFNLKKCWGPRFDVEEWLSAHFSESEIQALNDRPTSYRMQSVFDTLNRVKQQREENN